MEHIIQLKGISKVYDGKEVVKNVTMDIQEGQIYGFLGPNGAGKTTIMKMILNLVKPSSGTISVFGQHIQENSFSYLKKIGSIIENPIFYGHLTAYENLKLHGEYLGYYDQEKVKKMLDIVELNGAEHKKTNEFSLGMKQRLGIARAMLTGPELLILDEPINGLDPLGIKQIRELLLRLKREYGITMMISSHIISEIELIADTIGVINDGVLLREVGMDTVRQEAIQYTEIQVEHLQKAMSVLNTKFPHVNMKAISADCIRIYDDSIMQKDISRTLILQDISVYEMFTKNDSLEDYFIEIINGGKGVC
ncbi:MAG: ABC transporter ATP-binding protein [Lachnospiraceae bacterium]